MGQLPSTLKTPSPLVGEGWGEGGRRHAVILAGGASRRFGSDKTLAKFKGIFLMDILTKTLEATGHKIFFSGQKDRLSRWGFPIIEDSHVYEGPLCALQDILKKISAYQILVVACDMPFLTPLAIEEFWKRAKKSNGVVLSDEFPFPAIYSRKMLSSINLLIRNGRRDLKSLLKQQNGMIDKVEAEIFDQVDPSHRSLWNINTFDELEQLIPY